MCIRDRYLQDYYDFLAIKPTILDYPDAISVPQKITQGLRFERVGFNYPGTEEWALRNLSFTLQAGEKLALVGENGSGKTTLVKLIARMYDPSEGTIYPVSYTHLICYKWLIEHKYTPVSYTHLDVYKRQIINGAYSDPRNPAE